MFQDEQQWLLPVLTCAVITGLVVLCTAAMKPKQSRLRLLLNSVLFSIFALTPLPTFSWYLNSAPPIEGHLHPSPYRGEVLFGLFLFGGWSVITGVAAWTIAVLIRVFIPQELEIRPL